MVFFSLRGGVKSGSVHSRITLTMLEHVFRAALEKKALFIRASFAPIFSAILTGIIEEGHLERIQTAHMMEKINNAYIRIVKGVVLNLSSVLIRLICQLSALYQAIYK